jgi:hypothetical protein
MMRGLGGGGFGGRGGRGGRFGGRGGRFGGRGDRDGGGGRGGYQRFQRQDGFGDQNGGTRRYMCIRLYIHKNIHSYLNADMHMSIHCYMVDTYFKHSMHEKIFLYMQIHGVCEITFH